jgi:outer membrane protein OmpA-like peptidoglycan-associated protein
MSMQKVILLLLTALSFSFKAQDSLLIYFGFDSYMLTEKSRDQLNTLKKSSKNIRSIHGFTDTCGSISYNKWLSEKRIASVVKQLDPNLIADKNAFGEEFQFAQKNKENRKVLIIYNSSVTSENNNKKQSISAQITAAQVGEKIQLKSLNFYPGIADLLPQSTGVLQELLLAMNKNKKLIIEIHGHICCAPDDYANLSSERAQTVYQFLVNNGIEPARMTYKGFGVTQPLFPIPEKTEEERVGNRRVEIKIISN